MFNEYGFEQRVTAGLYGSGRLKYDGHPSPDRSGEPYCTRGQTIACTDETGDKIIEVHRYLRRDGSVGASGRLDPKFIFHDGVLYSI